VARALLPITGALIAGAVTAAGSGMALAWAFGASRQTILSLAPKSVTTPIAMGIAERIGGTPSLTAVLVILTGICGAIIARPLLNAIGVRDWRARGFAVGLAAHGLGTARAFQVDEVAGTFAGIAVGLNGIVTAVIVPLMASWFLPR
jgi:putative effector of murein hydrolase